MTPVEIRLHQAMQDIETLKKEVATLKQTVLELQRDANDPVKHNIRIGGHR